MHYVRKIYIIFVCLFISVIGSDDIDYYDDESRSKVLDVTNRNVINITNVIILRPQPDVHINGNDIPQPITVKPVTSKPVKLSTSKPVTAKPVKLTTSKPVSSKPVAIRQNVTAVTAAPVTTTQSSFIRYPCSCDKGICNCCTGSIMDAFNQKACLKISYEPDEFAFTAALNLNDVEFFKRKVSGKNPPPMCVRLPRIRAVRLCVKFSNIYFSGPNMHTCINFEASFADYSLIDTSFDCIRFGANGFASVQPEDGGGVGVVDEEDESDEDYDDSA